MRHTTASSSTTLDVGAHLGLTPEEIAAETGSASASVGERRR
jgi:hypothetical protein